MNRANRQGDTGILPVDSGKTTKTTGRMPVAPSELPGGWRSTKLAELCDLVSDQCDPSKTDAETYIGLEHIDPGAFSISRVGTPQQVVSAKNCFQTGDVLYGKLRPYLDKAVLAEQKGICSTDILVFRPRKAVDSLFVLAIIHSKAFVEYALQTTHGVNHPRTSWSALKEFPCHIPPLSEQRAIAGVLSKVQEAIAAEAALVRNARDLKKSLLYHLFTHGIRNEPLKQTEIGQIPKSWEVVPLGSIAQVGNGSTPKRTRVAYWQDGQTPWLTSAKVHDGVIHQADEFVTDAAVRECHLPRVKAGSLLIAITGQGKTLGNTAITVIETTISQHLAFAQFHTPDVESNFMRYFFVGRYEHLRQIALGGGSTKGALTCGLLKSHGVPFPTHAEQRDIAFMLQTADEKIAIHEAKQRELQDLFKTLLHQLMTGRVRVAGVESDMDTAP